MDIINRKKPWETPIGRILARYYKSQERMERLRKIESVIREDIRELTETIKTIMNTPKVTGKYGFRVFGSGGVDQDPNLTMMARLEEATEKAQEAIPEKYRRLISIQYRIHEIRRQIAPFVAAFGRLTDEERRVLELKYCYRKSNYSISNLLYCSEHKVRCIHGSAIGHLKDWLIRKSSQNRRKKS